MAQADEPDSYADELARIDASIADMKIRDMAAAKERTTIASKIQAAQFQRDILAHANQQKAKKATKTRRVRRQQPPGDTPPPGDPSRTARRPQGQPMPPRPPQREPGRRGAGRSVGGGSSTSMVTPSLAAPRGPEYGVPGCRQAGGPSARRVASDAGGSSP